MLRRRARRPTARSARLDRFSGNRGQRRLGGGEVQLAPRRSSWRSAPDQISIIGGGVRRLPRANKHTTSPNANPPTFAHHTMPPNCVLNDTKLNTPLKN